MSDSSTISFIEHLAPSLGAGYYEIAVSTDFDGTPGFGPEKISELSEWIFVGGERFFLNPADIDSVYPGENTSGDFSETLPHIVFSHGSFPWERKPKLGSLDRLPWLALLLFDEDDPAPTPKQIKIGDLATSSLSAGIWFPTPFEIEPDEDPNLFCTIIDIEKSLFSQMLSNSNDLKYMAHAREVNINKKAGQSHENDDATHQYSVVIGNRLPKPKKESVLHLVSLENYANLIDNEGNLNAIHTVRMVSLKSWRFSCTDRGGSFASHFKKLNNSSLDDSPTAIPITEKDPLFLHYPFDSKLLSNQKVGDFMRQGFIPMQHNFRMGLKSISWYRGPLIPLPQAAVLHEKAPFPSSDALLLYDSNIGYYDVSYAAAWQLGQLLGLKNKAFAKAQYFWKQQADSDALKSLERNLMAHKLPMQEAVTNEDGIVVMPLPNFEAVHSSVENISSATLSEPIKGTLNFQLDPQQKPIYPTNYQSEWYQTVQTFVDSLKMLHEVPWNYIIPDAAMLPPESIRFFYLDPNWITALVDGALSIGDVLDRDHVRKDQLLAAVPELKGNNAIEKYSGFLLRSSVMTIWPGLEVRAFNNEGNAVGFYRYERIAEDVLVCIVQGDIQSVEFREPPEGLHFGLKNPEIKDEKLGIVQFTKDIRPLNSSDESFTIEPKMETKERRVVNFTEIANKIAVLGLKNIVGESFTQADFGYIMVQPISSVKMTITTSKK